MTTNEITPTIIYTFKTEARIIIEIRHAEAWEAFADVIAAERVAKRFPMSAWRQADDAQRTLRLRQQDFRRGEHLHISKKLESWWAE